MAGVFVGRGEDTVRTNTQRRRSCDNAGRASVCSCKSRHTKVASSYQKGGDRHAMDCSSDPPEGTDFVHTLMLTSAFRTVRK
jgi:hypothetical protein